MPMRHNAYQVDQSFSTTSSCISHIKHEDMTSALSDYKTLEQLSVLNTIKQVIIRFFKFNKHFDNRIIKFLDKLPTLEETSLGYKILLQEMARNKEILRSNIMTVSYRVYTGLKKPNDLSQIVRDNYQCIWDNLPGRFKEFPWDRKFRLYNMGMKRYLIASDVEYDDQRQLTFLWKKIDTTELAGADVWTLEPFDNGMFFRLKSVKYNLFLYADTNEYKFSDAWRRVFLWKGTRPLQYSEWAFDPFPEDTFKLKQNRWNDFLGVTNSDYDDDRREMCTCKDEINENVDLFQWKVEEVF